MTQVIATFIQKLLAAVTLHQSYKRAKRKGNTTGVANSSHGVLETYANSEKSINNYSLFLSFKF